MRPRISIRGCVRPFVGPSINPSVGPLRFFSDSPKMSKQKTSPCTYLYSPKLAKNSFELSQQWQHNQFSGLNGLVPGHRNFWSNLLTTQIEPYLGPEDWCACKHRLHSVVWASGSQPDWLSPSFWSPWVNWSAVLILRLTFDKKWISWPQKWPLPLSETRKV